MTTATAVEFDFEKKVERTIPAALARESCKAGMFCWIDLDAAADPSAAANVLRDMGVNDHAIKEALGPDQDGRYDPYEDCLHTAVTSVDFRSGKLKAHHVDIVIGENFLVSLRRGPVDFVDQVRRQYRQDFLKFAKTGSFLLYEYWDALIDAYKRAIRHTERDVERVQDKIFGKVDDEIFNEVNDVTRDLLSFRKMMLAAREVLHEMSTRRSPFVSESSQPFMESMVGTMERLSSDLAVEREILAETLNLYMGIVSHRTNKVVNRLTVVSMVFLPLTFLCGVYGMNFDPEAGAFSMPELGWSLGYVGFWIVAIAMTATLLVYMKRRQWW